MFLVLSKVTSLCLLTLTAPFSSLSLLLLLLLFSTHSQSFSSLLSIFSHTRYRALVHFWFISICRSKKGGQQQREKVADRPEQDSVDIEAYIEQITESSIEDVFSCFAHQQRLATERIGTLLHSALFTSHCLNDYECSRTHLHHKLAGSHMLWLRWIEERLQELHSNEETSNSVTCSSCVSLS